VVTTAPPTLVEVRCPVSDHLLFKARAGAAVMVEIRCVCKRRLWVAHATHITVVPDR
jgi:hypothetical protein